MKKVGHIILNSGIILLAAGFFAVPAAAHCDTLQGPVVKNARAALDAKDVTPVLKWVRPQDEAEIRAAFKSALSVRSKGPAAQELADKYFFETAVRLHRASEGESFSGIKESVSDQALVNKVDRALKTGVVEDLTGVLLNEIESRLKRLFAATVEKQKVADTSVQAGRDYVAAYVSLLHFIEHLETNADDQNPHKSE